MAGSYPDVPAPRMAWDRDGSVGFWLTPANAVVVMSSADMQALNDEGASYLDWVVATGANNGDVGYVGVVFPERRNIADYFVVKPTGGATLGALQTSVDTTNGFDGTWVTVVAPWTAAAALIPNYRTAIVAQSMTGIKGIRFAMTDNNTLDNGRLLALHLYGSIASGESPHRLRLWHPTLDQEVGPAHFDWGDASRGTQATKTFRVKNNSPTYAALNILLATEALSDPTPSIVAQHDLSIDGVAFASTRTIPSIPVGGVSSVVTLRRTLSTTAALSLTALRVTAEAGTWS